MTQGTRTDDHRTTFTGDCGTGQVGSLITKTWSGSDDPKIHKKVNPYFMTYDESWDGPIAWINTGDPLKIRHSGTWLTCFGAIGIGPSNWSAADDLSLVNQLGDRIRKHQFNAAVSIGAEGKEALEQIAGATFGLVSGMKNLKRGNVGAALRDFGLSPSHIKKVGVHKDLSNKVLATQLGWMPLMSDISEAYDALRAITGKPQSMTYHAYKRVESPIYLSGGSGVQAGVRSKAKKLTWTLSENFTVWESLSCSNPYDLLNAGWNATSLSFIADWFIPIGSYLSARSLAYTLKGSGFVSTFDEGKVRGVSNHGVYIVEGADGYFHRTLTVTRSPLSSIDGLVSLPRFKDFNKVPSWKRALTAVTLATQMWL